MAAKRPSSGGQFLYKRQRGNMPEGTQDYSPHVPVNNAERDCWRTTLHYWGMNGYEAFGDIKFQMLGKGTELRWSDNFALSMSKLAACVAFRNDVEFFRLCLKVVNAVRHQSKLPDVRGSRVSSNLQALRDEIYAHHLDGFSSGNSKTIIEQAIIKHTTMVPRKHLAIFKDKYLYIIRPKSGGEIPSESSTIDQEDLNNLTKVVGAYAHDAGLETIESSWKTHGYTEISDETFSSMKLTELRRLGLVTQLHYFPKISPIRQNSAATSEDSESSAVNQGLVVYQKSTDLQDIERTAATIIQGHQSCAEDAYSKEIEKPSPASLRNIENSKRKVEEGVPNQPLNEVENLEPSHIFMLTDSPDTSEQSSTKAEDEADSLEPRDISMITGSRAVSEVSNIDTDLLIWGSSYESEEPSSEYNDLLTSESSCQSEEPELSHIVQFRLAKNIGRVVDETEISSVESFEQLIGWIQPFFTFEFTLWVKESPNGEASIVESDDDWAIAKEQFREEHDNRFVTTIFVADYEDEDRSTSFHANPPEPS